MPKDIARAISASDAKSLFADWADAPAIVLAVSGGPDSVALMWLAARWRKAMRRGPKLVAVTVDHGLRPESAEEAKQVASWVAGWPNTRHVILRWEGDKPDSRILEEARKARYDLMFGYMQSQTITTYEHG